jgi:prepilin-type N-terminal cleavage/methylation domain-containing protein
MKSLYSSTKSSAAQQGQTLVELLVAISLGSVVLAFLGGVLLVSEMRVSARIQRNLVAKDDANRAIDLIRREANFSSRIDSGDGFGTASPLTNCDNTPLTFHQNNLAKPICYKTVAPGQLTHIGVFQGPCVLVRLGYPYRSTGDIDPSSRLTSVLLDGVAVAETGSGIGCSSKGNIGLTAQLDSIPYRDNTLAAPPNRIANIRIKMASKASYTFSVRVPSNLAYDGMDLFRKCYNITGTCSPLNSPQAHYLPEYAKGQKVFTASESKENLFYFTYPFAQYQVTTCNYSNCTVTGGGSALELKNVDALIFPDKEIRPSR